MIIVFMKKEKVEIKRINGIDVVKTIAVFSVISVHFFLNNGFYQTIISDKRMFIAIFLRWIFMICVPLFLITTGYLMRKKEANINYYKGIQRIIISYVLISVLCFVVRKYFIQDGITWLGGIKGLFRFSLDGYSWYVNMYIGLFLLIPFLNIIYNNIRSDTTKLLLISTLIFLTSLIIMPNWWASLYPITYYMIGAFLSEKKIKINKTILFIVAFLLIIAESIVSFAWSYSKGITFQWTFSGWGALPTLIISVLIFLLFYDIDIKQKVFRNIFKTISKLTLEIYLISYIIDKIVYPHFSKDMNTVEILPYYIIIVPFIFLTSTILAIVINFIQEKIQKTITYILLKK
jgi:surface polysaccharide O-acyltransferase-like enzyme